MLYVKLHLLVTVLIVQTLALLDRVSTLPYFPIEISRTAASSHMAGLAFRAGAVTSFVTLYYTDALNWVTLLLWVGLMIIAFVPDNLHFAGHMSGVGVVFVASLLQAWDRPNGLIILTVAMLLFLSRNVLKFLVLQHDSRASWFSLDLYKEVTARNFAIMFSPPGQTQVAPDVLNVFRLGGVLQWVSFCTLSLLF